MDRDEVVAVYRALTDMYPGMGNPPAPLYELYTDEGVAIALVARLEKAGWRLVRE